MLVFSGRKKEKLKSSRKIDVAIIGGTGLESLLKDAEQTHIGTPYGLPSPIAVGEVDGIHVAFLPRHCPTLYFASHGKLDDQHLCS
jgi:purine nucleoside phosphorylase